MTDETTGATPEGTGATPEATTGATPEGNGAPPAEATTATVDETLGEAGRRALESERKARQEAERELKKYREAAMTADEKRDARLAELERENASLRLAGQQAALRSEVYVAAQKLGFRNPGLAYRMIDQAAVSYAEDGTPKNVAALLAAIAKEDPYLTTAATDYGGGPRGPAPEDVDMNTLIRRAARGH